MTPLEVLRAIEAAGVVLRADVDRIKGSPPEAVAALEPDVRSALDEHRPRILAVLKLRSIHRAMGLSEEDVLFVESAFLADKATDVRLVVRAPRSDRVTRAECRVALEKMAAGLEPDEGGVARFLERVSTQPEAEVLRDLLTETGAMALLRESR